MQKIIPGKWGYLGLDLSGPYSPPYLTWSEKAKMGKIWTSYHPSMHGEDQRGMVLICKRHQIQNRKMGNGERR